jgi:hypothetical protein
LRAAVGGPIVDDEFGWRAAVLYDKRDGWVRSTVPGVDPLCNTVARPAVEPLNGVDALSGRLSLMAQLGNTVTASLKFSVSRSGGTPYGAHALNVDPAYYSGNIGWFDNGAKYAIHKDIRNDSVSLKVDWQVSSHATLTSVTGFDYGRWYEKSDDGGLPIEARLDDPNTYFSSVNAFSQEIRLASHDTGAWAGSLDCITDARVRTRPSSSTSMVTSWATGIRSRRRRLRRAACRCGDSMSTTTSISSRIAGPCF